ncbi:MAG: glycosyltransferase [Verrucomicrobiota bacterium]
MQKILIAHSWMERGGSEATAMWALQALQDNYEVTFVTASEIDFKELNRAYGTKVDPLKIKSLKAPHLPTAAGPTKWVHAQNRLFERHCQKLAPRFDLCLSAYNPVDFGKPSIQLIGDFSFSEEMRKRLYTHTNEQFRHRDTLLRRLYLRLGDWIGVRQRPLHSRGDLLLANSQWSAGLLSEAFGVPNAPVIYPPVVLPKASPHSERNPIGFACLGRVVPEKEIERVVSILKAVRARGHAVTLRLMGALHDTPYSRSVGRLIAEESWIEPEGFLMLEEKQRILSSVTYALHACRIEAFGIAVAEMSSMGCIPFVPDTGGAVEIVDRPELQYGTDEEAVAKIVQLLENPDRLPGLRESLVGEMDRFGPEIFMKELREHVLEFMRSANLDGATEKDSAASH